MADQPRKPGRIWEGGLVTPPTPEEIRAAWESIDRDGPAAGTTIHLAALAMTDPTLSGVLGRMKDSHVARITPETKLFAEAMLQGALIYGLNMGIRIGEARAKRSGAHQ